MTAIAYLVLSWLAAAVVVQRLFPALPAPVRLAGAFGVSIAGTAWVTFGAAMLAHVLGTPDPTSDGLLAAAAVNAAVLVTGRRLLTPEVFRIPLRPLAGMLAALAASGWVVQQRLGGDPLEVSTNAWGDTALHIGIARSFSQGDNYPPQLPIFSGDGIRYHFGFDFYAGTLEKLGLPIDWAFNVPATLGFTAIVVLVASLAWHLWRSAWVGVVAAVLFLTNGSLAFLRYAARYPTLGEALSPSNWWHLDRYLAIAPYQNDEVISIFWTLNPYLTQTHLIVGMAIVLFVIHVLVWHLRPGEEERVPIGRAQAVALGVLAGASFWINGILVAAAAVLFGALLVVYRGSAREWWPFVAALGVTALPQAVWLGAGGASETSSVRIHWGYLVPDFRLDDPQSYLDLVVYWWLNLGVIGPLVVLAAVVVGWADRTLLAAIMTLFLVGNVVAFGEDVGGHGHKVFNLWETLVNLYAAYALVWLARRLWNGITLRGRILRVPSRVAAAVAVPVLAVLMVLSGLLDVMTLKNDPRYEVFGDNRSAIAWIEKSTRSDAVFLTAYGDPYTVPTLAGRRVYLGGFTGWAAGFGYDTAPREATIQAVYSAPDRAGACAALGGTGVDYVQVGSGETEATRFPRRNPSLFPGEFVTAWSGSGVTYYDVAASCGSAGQQTGGSS